VNVRRHWPIVVPFAFALAAFHAWFVPGLLLGDDQFRFSIQQLASYFPWRNAWDPSYIFGVPSGFSSPAYPLWAVAGALARLGLDFAAIERVVWFWPLFACLVIAPYAFVYRLTRAPWAAGVAAAVFAVNTWTISLVQRGHIPSLVAYALTPLVALAWLTLLRKRRPMNAVAFAALLTIQVMYDLRYAYIAAAACLIVGAVAALRAFARRRYAPVHEFVSSALWTIAALLAFNAYWLIPQFAAPAHLPAGYDTLSDFRNDSQSQSLASALALFYPFYHYVQGANPFAPSPVEPSFFIVFALVFVAAISVCRRWVAIALIAAGLVGIILTSGPNSPFGTLDEFAFAHVPGMTLFRDISKFSAIVGFAYAALLGFGFARLAAAIRAGAGRRMARPLAAALACIGIAAYAWLLRDTFNPLRLSNFATTVLSHDDLAMQDYLDRQPGYFRTILFPTWRPELVGTAAHPVVSADYLVDSAASDGGLGEFFPSYAPLIQRLASPLLPKLLAEASVRYVVVDDDPKGVLYKPFAYNVAHAESVAFFRARPWLREVARFGGYVVFELTPASAARAYFARSPLEANGPPQSLAALVGTPAWSGLPAVVIPAVPFADPSHVTFVSDPTSDAETVTADFSTANGGMVRAWVGADPSDILSRPTVRMRTRHTDKLTMAPIPDQPTLPTRPVTVEIVDPRIMSAPYADPPTGAQWRGIVGPSAEIELINWSDTPLSADVTLPVVFAPDSRERLFRVTAGDVTQTFVVTGELFGYAPRAPVVLPGLVLEPGLNAVRLDVSTRGFGRELPAPPNEFSVIFADDIAIAVRSGDAAFVRHASQPADQPRASFALFPSLSISLARDPTLSLTYEVPRGAARIALYAELRRRDDSARLEFVHALPSSVSSDSVDLFKAVQDALDADGSAAPSTLSADDASAYDLVAVRLLTIGSDIAHGPRNVDARIDVSQVPGDAIPSVRFVDLRGSNVNAAGASSKLDARLVHVQAPDGRTMSSLAVVVPLPDGQAAGQLVLWSRSSPDAAPVIDLTFTSQSDGRIAIVPAVADASDPFTPMSTTISTHVVAGYPGRWRRFVIDLGALEADQLPNRGARYALTGIQIAGAQGPVKSMDLSDLALVSEPLASTRTTDAEPSQSLKVDGRTVSLNAWHQDSLTQRFVAETAPFGLVPGRHSLSVEPSLPLHSSSIYVAFDGPPSKISGHVRGFTVRSPSEYVADVNYGGLLVWPMSYAPGWQAFRIPADDSSVTPSGFALLDAWRFRADRVPETYHFAVNCTFNGWFVLPGASRVVLLYEPEALSELAALLWLLLSTSVVITAVAVQRARP
jgi:hypothetical protein